MSCGVNEKQLRPQSGAISEPILKRNAAMLTGVDLDAELPEPVAKLPKYIVESQEKVVENQNNLESPKEATDFQKEEKSMFQSIFKSYLVKVDSVLEPSNCIECPVCMSDLDIDIVLELVREARFKQKLRNQQRDSDSNSDQESDLNEEIPMIKEEVEDYEDFIANETDVKTEPVDDFSNQHWQSDDWTDSL